MNKTMNKSSEVISKAEAARRWQVGRSAVSAYCGKGMPVRPDGKLDWVTVDQWRSNFIVPERAFDYQARQRAKSQRASPAIDSRDVDVPLPEAIRRKEAALARIREADAAEREGALVSIEDVSASWAAMIGAARAKLLGIGMALGSEVAALNDPAECASMIDSAIKEALRELATEDISI